MNDTVLFEVKDHIAIITLNRPEVDNVINVPMMEGIKEAVKRVSEDEDIRCLLYTSPSPRDHGTSRMPSSA